MVFLLLICTSAYAHQLFPSIMDRNKDGFVSFEAHIHCGLMASRQLSNDIPVSLASSGSARG